MPVNSVKPWTDNLDAELISLLVDGMTINDVSLQLGRSRLAVISRIALLIDEHFLSVCSKI